MGIYHPHLTPPIFTGATATGQPYGQSRVDAGINGFTVDRPPVAGPKLALLAEQYMLAQPPDPIFKDNYTSRKLNNYPLITVLTADVGAFLLTGQNATFLITFNVDVGTFTLTGNAAQGITIGPSATGTYTLSGQSAGYSLDFNPGSVGSSMSGGTFSRGRWRKVKEQEAEELAAAVRAEQKAKRQAEEAAQRAREAAKAALDEFRRNREIEWGIKRKAADAENARQSVLGAQKVQEAMRQAAVKAAAARSAGQKLHEDKKSQEEEDAFLEKLLMED